MTDHSTKDAETVCALLAPRKRGQYAECRHTEVTRAGGECKYGSGLMLHTSPGATDGE